MDWVFGPRKADLCQSFSRQDVYTGSTPVEGEEKIRAHRLKASVRAATLGSSVIRSASDMPWRVRVPSLLGSHTISHWVQAVLEGKQLSVTEITAEGTDLDLLRRL